MTVAEAARELNIRDIAHVYKLLAVGELIGEKVGRVWRVDRASVEARAARLAAKEQSNRVTIAPAVASVLERSRGL